jgi:hypothetical protein
MSFLNILVVGFVLAFFIGSVALFIRRFQANKAKIRKIGVEDNPTLKYELERELKLKKEEELKKLQSGDKETIMEVIDRLFKSSKLAGLIKSKNFNLYNQKTIAFIVNLTPKEELVDDKKEITLKNGEVYTQNKHYLAVNKEYGEKVFLSSFKVVEEVFNAIPTIYKMYISVYETVDSLQKCIVSFEVNRDQYNAIGHKNNIMDKLDFFQAKHNYDQKNYIFNEVEPVNTPSGEISLEKTMATKAASNTSFYGTMAVSDSSIINLKNESVINDNNLKATAQTKISDLNGSIMLNKTMLDIPSLDTFDNNEDLSDFEIQIVRFFEKYDYQFIKEEVDDLNTYKYVKKNDSTILVGIYDDYEVVKDEFLKKLYHKMIKENIEKGIFITSSSFSLDCVTYASVNQIEIYDFDKIKKLVS